MSYFILTPLFLGMLLTIFELGNIPYSLYIFWCIISLTAGVLLSEFYTYTVNRLPMKIWQFSISYVFLLGIYYAISCISLKATCKILEYL